MYGQLLSRDGGSQRRHDDLRHNARKERRTTPTSSPLTHQQNSYSVVYLMAGSPRLRPTSELFLRWDFTSSDCIPFSFVQIHVDAYMLTLPYRQLVPPMSSGSLISTYRSIHAPGTRTATLLHAKPSLSKTVTYHGSRPALRSITLPLTFNALLSARICRTACFPSGGNQSMLSITTTIVSVPGRIRAMTSLISSVWMRSPLNAEDLLSLM